MDKKFSFLLVLLLASFRLLGQDKSTYWGCWQGQYAYNNCLITDTLTIADSVYYGTRSYPILGVDSLMHVNMGELMDIGLANGKLRVQYHDKRLRKMVWTIILVEFHKCGEMDKTQHTQPQ